MSKDLPTVESLSEQLKQCQSENAMLHKDNLRILEDRDSQNKKLQSITSWSKAYPLDIFLKPDLKKVATVLEEAGLSLDAVSADSMRHVLEGIMKIVEGE